MTTLAKDITTAETAAKQAWITAREDAEHGSVRDRDRKRQIASLLAAGYDQIQRAGKLAGENGDEG